MSSDEQTRLEEYLEYSWLQLGDVSKIKTPNNPLLPRTDKDKPGLQEIRLMREPWYIGWTVKTLLGIDLLPYQQCVLHELWTHPFSMIIMARGGSKTYLMAIYTILKMALYRNYKVITAGSAFRQSKLVFDYAKDIIDNAPVLRSICKDVKTRTNPDQLAIHINNSKSFYVPVGSGEKIRGYRANMLLIDEFNSLNPEIFEVVMQGFLSVSSSPVDNVKRTARREAKKKAGLWSKEQEQHYKKSQSNNELIISGTSGYSFQHFADYWKRYHSIISSKGDLDKLESIMGEIPDGFDWRDYTIIRIPHTLIPKSFMDEKQLARAKATIHSGAFACEFLAVFSDDSAGFFRRSLIEKCIANEKNSIQLSSGPVIFGANTRGHPEFKYVMGVDPALGSSQQGQESDNFSIIVLEIHKDHVRIVYCWSINRKQFKERLKLGLTTEHDYYSFCAKKIRQLRKTFYNIERIGMDSQGGGIAILEALSDPDKIPDGERPIYEIIEEGKEKETDHLAGDHILEIVQFAKYDWVKEANHNMKKDFEDRALLFPEINTADLALAAEEDRLGEKLSGKDDRHYDSLEDCMMEIEELKDELSTIVVTEVGTGINMRQRWDTPEVKLPGNKRGRLRKDRYSALLIANAMARQITRSVPLPHYPLIGANLKSNIKKKKGRLYDAPEWYTPIARGINR